MTHSMVKTRPAAQQYTGALIRAALDRYDVTHRVGSGPIERGWLVTTGHSGAPVYVTAHHPKRVLSYDVPTDGLTSMHAVIIEGSRT
ncbi:hypothetical protein, partial [Streptomyces chartreusis]